MLYTTLTRLRAAGADTPEPPGKRTVPYVLSQNIVQLERRYGQETLIPLTVVLDALGLYPALWCLRATTESSAQFSLRMAGDYAAHVEPLPHEHRLADIISMANDMPAELELDSVAASKLAKLAAELGWRSAAVTADVKWSREYTGPELGWEAAQVAGREEMLAASMKEQDWQIQHLRQVLTERKDGLNA